MRSAAVRVSPQREFVVHVCNVDGCVLVASFIWQVELFLFCDMDVTKNSHSNVPTYVHMYRVYVSPSFGTGWQIRRSGAFSETIGCRQRSGLSAKVPLRRPEL